MKLTIQLLEGMGLKEIKGFSRRLWYLPDNKTIPQTQYQFELRNKKNSICTLKGFISHITNYYYELGKSDKEREVKKCLGIKE